MNICVVTDDYLPDSTRNGAKMMHELCVELTRRKHNVTVIAPQSHSKINKHLSIDGVQIRHFPSGPIKNVSKLRRVLNESMLPWRAWHYHRKYFCASPHDFIIFYSPSIFWGPLICRLKKLWKVPVFLVLRDFFPQWAIDIGMLREGAITTRYLRACEAATYAQSDVIGVQSANNLDIFRRTHPDGPQLELLYNWAEDRPGRSEPYGFRKRLKLEDKVIFFYGGSITDQQDIPNLLRLAESLSKEPEAHFLIVGEGYDLPNVRAIIERRQLTNVTIHAPVDQETFRNLLDEVDIGLFSLARSHSTHNFPGKVLGYLVQGLPVLGSVNPGNDLLEVINEAGAGFVAINGEDEKLAQAAMLLLRDVNARRAAGAAARKLLSSKFSVISAANIIEGAVMPLMEAG